MWQKAPTVLKLQAEEVHIWRVRLDRFAGKEALFWSSLSEEEQKRANRFHFAVHRLEFIAARGILRILLGRYLEQAPADLVFGYGAQEKPFLPASPFLAFNISHSHSMALLAFGRLMEIGVDLEKINSDIDIASLCKNFFSPNESASILALSGKAQFQAFFNCWTRKEAFIKAKGQGLSLPLDQFEVSLLPEDPVRLLATHWDSEEAASWYLSAIFPEDDFAGALAVNRELKSVNMWDY